MKHLQTFQHLNILQSTIDNKCLDVLVSIDNLVITGTFAFRKFDVHDVFVKNFVSKLEKSLNLLVTCHEFIQGTSHLPTPQM